MNNIQFSVLSYYPSFIGIENIQVGIAFINLDTMQRKLELTTNWDRVKSYDDELDIDMFKMMLNSLKDSYESETKIEKDYLSKFTRFYINELKFDNIVSVYDNDFNSFIERTKKVFLRFDDEKNKRMTKDEQLLYLRQLIKGSNLNYNSKPLIGEYDENLHFDYVIDGKYAIKVFNFKNKDLSKLINMSKSWAYNVNEMKDRITVVFIYNIDELSDENKKYYYTILQILSNATKHVYNMADGLNFINNNISENLQTKFEI